MLDLNFGHPRRVLLTGVALVLSGCASTPDEYRDPRDPLEPLNRAIFTFNDNLDRAVLKPVAKGYQAITPAPVDRGVEISVARLELVLGFVSVHHRIFWS